jgi:hypothetical protein
MPKPVQPIRRTWRARRGQPFKWVAELRGIDLTGAEVRAQVRPYPDAATLLVDLPWTPAPIQTSDDGAATCWVDLTGTIPVSFVALWIRPVVITQLEPFATNGTRPGQPLVRAMDVMITEAGESPWCWWAGDFILSPGVSKNA